MPIVCDLAEFVVSRSFEDLSSRVKRELKIRVLDSLGCAISALEGEPIVVWPTPRLRILVGGNYVQL